MMVLSSIREFSRARKLGCKRKAVRARPACSETATEEPRVNGDGRELYECPLRLVAPGHEALDPADACKVVIDDRYHEHHQEDKAGQEHLLLDLRAEVASRDPLERHDEDVPAVEHGDRQQ